MDLNESRSIAVLVLNEVDKLSREAQHSLRRTMEKYSASCRLILCCNSSSKVTEAVRSRCLNVRVNAPTEEEVGNGIVVDSSKSYSLIYYGIKNGFLFHCFIWNEIKFFPCISVYKFLVFYHGRAC